MSDQHPLSPLERARITYRWDLVRGAGTGIIESCWHTFMLLIAIRVFDAPFYIKAALPASYFLGLLITPASLSIASRTPFRTGHICALYSLVIAVMLWLMGLAATLPLYLGGAVIGQMSMAQTVPLNTHIYANNYASTERGRRFSTTFFIAAITGIICSLGGGWLLDINLSWYPYVLFVCAVGAIVAALAFYKMPTEPLPESASTSPSQNISLMWKDKLFGAVLFAWMLMGMANLMTLPLRVEYMANPVFGVDASNKEIGLITGGIPLVMRLLSSKVWGFLFDKWNFVTMRITLNLCFFLSMALFFYTKYLWLMCISMALLGLAMGGGRIMWTLWVTKIAPEEKVSAYMSIHGMMTGVRGSIAAFIGFYLISHTNPQLVAWLSSFLIAISTIIFMPIRTAIRKRNACPPVD